MHSGGGQTIMHSGAAGASYAMQSSSKQEAHAAGGGAGAYSSFGGGKADAQATAKRQVYMGKQAAIKTSSASMRKEGS